MIYDKTTAHNHLEDDCDDHENDYVFLAPVDCRSMAVVVGILILFLIIMGAGIWKLACL